VLKEIAADTTFETVQNATEPTLTRSPDLIIMG